MEKKGQIELMRKIICESSEEINQQSFFACDELKQPNL